MRSHRAGGLRRPDLSTAQAGIKEVSFQFREFTDDELEDEAVPGAPGHTISVIPGGQAVVDRADVTSADREYFEQNPDSDEYEREALPIELDQAGSSPKFGPRSGRVRVRRLAKGLRVRQLLRTCQ